MGQIMEQITEKLNMEEIEAEKAKEQIGRYDYIIAHMISDLQYGVPGDVQIQWDELVELRAFNRTEELHVFEHEWDSPGKLRAVRISETEGGGDCLVKSYRMRNGKILNIKEYLAADEDGQAVVVYTRPFAVTEEAEYGRE
ncbi:hypothetical protein AALC75_02805 [Lachnospiraceae bacterium 48-42]|jgi:hypothetical protein|nr:hypothetical protein [Dorea sp.]